MEQPFSVGKLETSLLSENSEVNSLRLALSQATKRIAELERVSRDRAGSESRLDVNVDVTPRTNNARAQTLRDVHQRSTVNMNTHDGENFVTDWDRLVQLPPPPDHPLRSPIVGALLEHWTSDDAMHKSLISWMERVLDGADPDTVPPLTISCLDHQVRDGFTMHVIPLLLRRPDIRVEVKTRAHRKTSHDLSVVVQPNAAFVSETDLENTPMENRATRAQVMAFKASHSESESFNDSIIVNVNESITHPELTRSAGAVQLEVVVDQAESESMHRSNDAFGSMLPKFRDRANPSSGLSQSSTHCEDESLDSVAANSQRSSQANLMGAITSFGGFLARRKSPNPFSTVQDDTSMSHSSANSGSSRPHADEQPYHRVVSAPPGRIGVTFVQYRGHAMVSDVADDSPLSGWVFPSDILIAIDEIPVSGMRVRDIVKVLTTRKDRQRALRVISSHAMNEFTLNASSVIDQPT